MKPMVPDTAPWCAAADPNTRKPKIAMPQGATDCHAHVCGPFARYDYAPERIYTPPDATHADYRKMLDTLGITRAVLVQPSVYGSDNTCMLDAMAEDPQRLRGVAVVDPDISAVELKRLDAAGVRGVRVNIVDRRERRNEIVLDELLPLTHKIADLGWHLEMLAQVDAVPGLIETAGKLPVDLVLGHLGYVHADKGGAGNAGFADLLRLMAGGRTWVKLTGPYRISAHDLPYGDVPLMAHQLLMANPERLLWGTDWPHVMTKKAMPNDADLADLLLDWVPSEVQRKAILVDNPAMLYGF